MNKPIVVDHGVYTRDNPYGYTFNVNHPIIKKIYERYKERKGLSGSYPVSDAERRRFDWYIGKLIDEGVLIVK